MSDVIISIPGATDVIVSGAAASSVVVTFPASNNFVTTIIDRGILYGVTGAQGPTGPQGSQGIQGIPGIGIAAGGSVGQVLKKNSATDYDTSWLTLDKTAVGLSNVDNTTDLLKPISNATQTALNGKQATISLTTTGSSGASTFAANVLNIPTYTLSGLGGQPLNANLTSISALTFSSTSFVKMTASGTFALDTNTYLTAESDTLASVTGRGNTTTNVITVGGLTVATNLIYTDTVNSRVGIGTSSPTRTLTVNGPIVIPNNNAYYTKKTDGGEISIFYVDTSNNYQYGSVFNGAASIFYTATVFDWYQYPSGVVTQRMRLSATGGLILSNGGTFTDAGFRLDVVGADSRFNGIRAGLGAGQVATNTVFGFAGLNANSTGMRNTAIGYQALTLSTGNNNTAVGSGTLSVNTTGSSNVGVGVGALVTNTTGLDNTACGTAALNQNITGDNNTAFGRNALLSNQTGIQITAIGRSALQNNTASNNTAVGYQAALANTTGTGITAIGYQALKDSTGANNTAIGFQSLSAHTTGTNNTALGHLTVSGNFSGCLILGKDATATANNQFVVGSSTVNAGSITAASSPTINEYWTVIINGVSKKIALIA